MFVLRLEDERLRRLGARNLANRIEHVSTSRGDGVGYDIMSFERSGEERFIEVKTTRFGEMTPFYATRNEVEVSAAEPSRYHLYRVYQFEKDPKVFILRGSLRDSVSLDPIAFRAAIR